MATQFGGKDVIDSRDIQERIDELQEIADEIEDANGELEEGEEPSTMDEEDRDELDALIAFKEEVNSSEWESGIGFIRESYFEDYAREYAQDIGAIEDDAHWPATHINWEEAAEELLIDYSSAELDGDTYYYN